MNVAGRPRVIFFLTGVRSSRFFFFQTESCFKGNTGDRNTLDYETILDDISDWNCDTVAIT